MKPTVGEMLAHHAPCNKTLDVCLICVATRQALLRLKNIEERARDVHIEPGFNMFEAPEEIKAAMLIRDIAEGR